jgi:hypothetical protein
MHEVIDVNVALTIPRLISDYSAWVPHIPFAFTVMDLLRPHVFVELGTHKGDSYGVFCQAAELLKLETRCTAVDTWKGDASAGFYDGSVLAELRAHHDPLYSSFSALLESTFDDAAGRFADGSIDLLHLDGSHDEAAVRRDFATWRPRLSDRAVVLFHDTQVFADNFGVHRVWRELAESCPHFEFLHGYGLGVLAVGRDLPRRFLDFLEYAGACEETVRSFYAALGQRLEFSRALGLLSREIGRQSKTANEWRTNLGVSPLPAPSIEGSGTEALSPQAADPKAWLDRLAWHAVHISNDFAHAVTVAAQNAGARRA